MLAEGADDFERIEQSRMASISRYERRALSRGKQALRHSNG
jgi:hypothetical protein